MQTYYNGLMTTTLDLYTLVFIYYKVAFIFAIQCSNVRVSKFNCKHFRKHEKIILQGLGCGNDQIYL